MILLRSEENRYHSSINKITLQYTNLEVYALTDTSLPADANPYGKGCIIASNKSDKLIYCEILFQIFINYLFFGSNFPQDLDMEMVRRLTLSRQISADREVRECKLPCKETVSREKRREF